MASKTLWNCCSPNDNASRLQRNRLQNLSLPCTSCDLEDVPPKGMASLDSLDPATPVEIPITPSLPLDPIAILNDLSKADPNITPLEGAWEEPRGSKRVHVIQGSVLRWSNGLESLLEVDGKAIKLVETAAVGQLDPGGQKLEWNDGDTWTRGGLNGLWVDKAGSACHTIEGATLRTNMKSWSAATHSLLLFGPRSFSINLEGTTHTAMVDPSGMKLYWLDGDIWTRF